MTVDGSYSSVISFGTTAPNAMVGLVLNLGDLYRFKYTVIAEFGCPDSNSPNRKFFSISGNYEVTDANDNNIINSRKVEPTFTYSIIMAMPPDYDYFYA